MPIDWFTVAAQVVNFLILVWLLKRFLYKPILHAIDAREQRIANELADAHTKQSQAESQRDEFQKKNEEFDRQRGELLSKAKDEASVERQRLLEEARKESDALRAKRQEALHREQQNLNDEITRRTQKEVLAIARKTLTDLAGTSLEERMSDVFAGRLRELDREAREDLANALKTRSEPVLVRSAFELPPEQRAAINDALGETFSADVQVRFETAPDVISGVELLANGRKVAWSIADYLASLEESVGELLKEQSSPAVKAEATPEARAESRPESETEGAVPEEAQ